MVPAVGVLFLEFRPVQLLGLFTRSFSNSITFSSSRFSSQLTFLLEKDGQDYRFSLAAIEILVGSIGAVRTRSRLAILFRLFLQKLVSSSSFGFFLR